VAWPAAEPGDALTRNSIRLALAFYALALLVMPWLDEAGWAARTPRGAFARLCWVLALVTYLLHVALAFHYFHHWSHAEAVAHVQERSGFGPGIAFSHLVSLLWSADAAWWALAPNSYARRPGWVGAVLHGYLLFMTFNATVVYESGAIRWAALALFAALAVSVYLRFRPRPVTGEPA
jgi:hypothetical protein